MNKRTLGNTGIRVSEISFGCGVIGIPYGLEVHSKEDLPTEKEAVHLLLTAVDGGINFFDTSRGYGQSEKFLGTAFKRIRNSVIICTKTGSLCDNDGRLPAERSMRDILYTWINESLATLQTDYVDILLIGGRISDEMIESQEIADTFKDLKRKGITRAIGVSTYGTERARKAIESGNWDVIQFGYNLMDQSHASVLPLAEEHGVGVVIRSVLLKGILTDKGTHLHEALESVEIHRERYFQFLSDEVPTLTDLAVKFVLTHKEISSVLLGLDRIEYLQKALKLSDGKYLDAPTHAKIMKEAYPNPDFIDLPLWDKKGWLH